MIEKKTVSVTSSLAAPVVALILLAASQPGCGATCDRMEEDRERFLSRKARDAGDHVEVLVPFGLAERLVEAKVSEVKPVDVKLPGLGKLGDYLGELSVAPRRVRLLPADPGQLGFHLDFDVLDGGKKAFSMYMEAVVRPEIDLAAGKVSVGFTPEVPERAKPGISKDAKKDLGGMIYGRLPAAARIFIPRAMVDAAAASAVELLMSRFYGAAKERMLPKLAEMSRFELTLPDVPLASVSLTSTKEGGGRLRLAMVTSLPVRAGIAEAPRGAPEPPRDRITVRMSGSTVAELVNWAMGKGLVPDRYDSKGKPREDGELRPGLDWVRGEDRPMKVYLWDLEKPCMRITMAARPSVRIVEDRLEIEALDTKTEDVEASAFTKVGVWFYILWKDAMKLNQKTSSRMELNVAGQEIEASVREAVIEEDELTLGLSLEIEGT